MIETGKYYKLLYEGYENYNCLFYVVEAKGVTNDMQRAVILAQSVSEEYAGRFLMQDVIITLPLNPREVYIEITTEEFLRGVNGAYRWKDENNENN